MLWKAICREWDAVNRNVSLNLGNGRRVLFWKDSWLEGFGPLINQLNSEVQVESLNHTVAEMVDGGGNWKWEVFAHLLPMQAVMGIAGYIPPRQDALEDTMIWEKSVNGRFTIKTAYMVREEDESIDRDPIWRIIWKWKGMERIKMFLWTVAHNAIMTNEMRWRRRISDNKCCCECVNEVETLTHALRDCPKAQKI